MLEGLNIDPQILMQVQANMLSDNAVRMAQLEAGIQQLTMRNMYLESKVAEYENPADEVVSAIAEEVVTELEEVDANPIE